MLSADWPADFTLRNNEDRSDEAPSLYIIEYARVEHELTINQSEMTLCHNWVYNLESSMEWCSKKCYNLVGQGTFYR